MFGLYVRARKEKPAEEAQAFGSGCADTVLTRIEQWKYNRVYTARLCYFTTYMLKIQ